MNAIMLAIITIGANPNCDEMAKHLQSGQEMIHQSGQVDITDPEARKYAVAQAKFIINLTTATSKRYRQENCVSQILIQILQENFKAQLKRTSILIQ
jgi:hypothetical protein